MNRNDLDLNRDDFDDCFAGEPPDVPPAADLARWQRGLRRRRQLIGGTIGGLVAAAVIAVPILSSQAVGPELYPAVPPTPAVAVCTSSTIKISDAVTDPSRRPVVGEKLQRAEEDGKSVRLLGVAATGEMLLEIDFKDGNDQDQTDLRPGQLYLEDPATGKRTLVRGDRDRHERTRTIWATFDQNFVVWAETGDVTVNAPDWEMYAFDRATNKISKVSGSDAAPDDDFAPSKATLWNGSVYWTEIRNNPDPTLSSVFNIYGRDLRNGEPARLVVENATEPAATEGWLYYLTYDLDWSDPDEVRRTSLTEQRTELVHKDGSVPAVAGDVRAWIDDGGIVVYRGTTQIARLVPPAGQSVTSVTAGNDAIGFTAGPDGQEDGYLLDLRGGCQLTRLADANGLASVELAGPTIAWSVEDPDQQDRPAWFVGRLR